MIKSLGNKTFRLGDRQLDLELRQNLYYKCQQEYLRKRLLAIKYLYEGKNRAEELAVHVSLEASNIIQEASRSYNELNATSHTANQPFSTRSVPTSSVPGLVPVDHAGKVDLPNDFIKHRVQKRNIWTKLDADLSIDGQKS